MSRAAWIDYDQHARTRPRDDLWGQVRRTVHGKPVAPEQIDLIVEAIRNRLDLQPDDVLLDLACGNGALTACLHPECAESLGVDASDYMIGVAYERFASPEHRFRIGDVAAYAEQERRPARFTKALCYGSLAYFDDDCVARLFAALTQRFTRVTHVFLGNLPDPARAACFYGLERMPSLREARSPIGVWRSAEEIASLAGPAWLATPSAMPRHFFAAHYRFDLLLTRRA